MKKLLVTGSGGLIGSEAVAFFAAESAKVHGVDNNLRADFFGAPGDTSWNTKRLQQEYVDKNRIGDHICYISDLSKMRVHYPSWNITKGLETIFREIYEAWRDRSAGGASQRR